MAKDKQSQPPQQQRQHAGQTENNQPHQGGRTDDNAGSRGQGGGRQTNQSLHAQSGGQQGKQSSERGRTSNQFGATNDDHESPTMTEAGQPASDENSSEKLRRGALDAQYGTDSSSKIGQQTNRPQGSADTGSSETPTGSDRDTMDGSRIKNR